MSPFDGPGEMRARCRTFDWSASPLGAVAGWSHSLRTTVSNMMASRHPMFLWWGPDLIQIFNDGYLPSFGTSGRDVAALGARGREHWSDIWHIIGPEVAMVMATAESSWHEDHLVPIERNGRMENVWWTYGYSPVRDDDGSIGGVLVVVQETTSHVLGLTERERLLDAERVARAEADRLRMEAERARERLGTMFEQAPAFISVVRGPDFVLEMANEAYLQLVGRRDIVGRPIFDAVPESRGQGFEELLTRVLETGEPYVGRELPLSLQREPGAAPEQRFVTFVYARIDDRDGTPGVFVHGVDVTEDVRARRLVERARDESDAARLQMIRLLALANALSSATTTTDVAGVAAEHAAIVLGATGVVLARLEEGATHLVIVDASDMTADLRSTWQLVPMDADLPLSHVARSGEALFVASRDEWKARYSALLPMLAEAGHHANAIVPLIAHDRVIGVLGAAYDAPRSFDESDRALVLAVASQCAQAFERARLFEAEHAAREKIEAANRIKSEFMAVMSHELRTPLNSIGGYAELIDLGIHGPVTAEQHTALSRIQLSQRHLLGLIENVLRYSRIDAGATQYDLTDVPVDDVLRACEALVLPQARAKRIELAGGRCAASLTARADSEKAQQILLNLLSNALKFTDAGGRVWIDCAEEDGGVRIRVRDTGRGIPEDYRERIFLPFVQVDVGLSSKQEGTGLGLAISRDLARGMGGDLTVESTVDVGSVFTLALPSAS